MKHNLWYFEVTDWGFTIYCDLNKYNLPNENRKTSTWSYSKMAVKNCIMVISTFSSRKFLLKIIKCSVQLSQNCRNIWFWPIFSKFWFNSQLMSTYEIWYVDSAKWVSNIWVCNMIEKNFPCFLETFSRLLQTTAADMLRKCSEISKKILG